MQPGCTGVALAESKSVPPGDDLVPVAFDPNVERYADAKATLPSAGDGHVFAFGELPPGTWDLCWCPDTWCHASSFAPVGSVHVFCAPGTFVRGRQCRQAPQPKQFGRD